MDRRDKQFLVILLFLTFVISLVELLGVSAILPFIAIVSDFSLIYKNKYIHFFYSFLHFNSPVQFIIILGILLICYYFLRGVLNFLYYYILSRFSYGRYKKIADKLLNNYLFLPYIRFIEIDSPTIFRTILGESQSLSQLISSMILLISELFTIILLYILLLLVNWESTLILTITFSLIFLFFIKTISKQIKKESTRRAVNQKTAHKVVTNTINNFKWIRLIASEKLFFKHFTEAMNDIAKSNIIYNSLVHFPRLFLEFIGFAIIIFIVIFFISRSEENISNIIPYISVYVVALYRILPSYNRILSSYNAIMFNIKSVYIIGEELSREPEALGDEKIVFHKEIKLKNIYFNYENNKCILKNIEMVVVQGSRVSIEGASGTGKSTLLDLIMGLQKPDKGEVLIDGVKLEDKNIKNWRMKIGYIPQDIFLFDGTLAENIVFGRKYVKNSIISALEKANMEHILMRKKGINTKIGEGGINLSGGEKQRLAIARAIYGNPEIIIMDEATSALDLSIETKIMSELYNICHDKTLIIVSHRQNTVKNCDKSYEIKNGHIYELI